MLHLEWLSADIWVCIARRIKPSHRVLFESLNNRRREQGLKGYYPHPMEMPKSHGQVIQISREQKGGSPSCPVHDLPSQTFLPSQPIKSECSQGGFPPAPRSLLWWFYILPQSVTAVDTQCVFVKQATEDKRPNVSLLNPQADKAPCSSQLLFW